MECVKHKNLNKKIIERKIERKNIRFFLFFSNNKVGGDTISFQYRYRKQIFLGIFLFLLLLGCAGGSYFYFHKTHKKKTSSSILLAKKEQKLEEKEAVTDKPIEYKVDIKGEILHPGIYTLPLESRVIDVIEKAGGLTENANTTVINLSKKITDEMVIIIYSNEEVADFEKTKEKEQSVIEHCIQKEENALKNDACIPGEEKETTAVPKNISLNQATKEELLTLPGIGESKAQAILQYRQEHGSFKTIEEVKEVSGIGESIFEQIRAYLAL